MTTPIRIRKGTKAGLQTRAAAGELASAEPLWITDEERLAVGVTANTYSEIAKKSELDALQAEVDDKVSFDSASDIVVHEFTTDSRGTAAYTLPVAPASKNACTVILGGTPQHLSAFEVAGTNFTFVEAPGVGELVEVKIITAIAVAYTPDNSVTAAKMNAGDSAAIRAKLGTDSQIIPHSFVTDARGTAAYTLPVAPPTKNYVWLIAGEAPVSPTDYEIVGTDLTFNTDPGVGLEVHVKILAPGFAVAPVVPADSVVASMINAGDAEAIRTKIGAVDSSNIVGVVGQSGGIPTGAIIERGSNANGEYVKFADGTMICSHKFLPEERVMTTAYGSIYYATVVSRTFPAVFAAPPSVAAFIHETGGGIPSICQTGVTASSFSYYVTHPRTFTLTIGEGYMAIGRWF